MLFYLLLLLNQLQNLFVLPTVRVGIVLQQTFSGHMELMLRLPQMLRELVDVGLLVTNLHSQLPILIVLRLVVALQQLLLGCYCFLQFINAPSNGVFGFGPHRRNSLYRRLVVQVGRRMRPGRLCSVQLSKDALTLCQQPTVFLVLGVFLISTKLPSQQLHELGLFSDPSSLPFLLRQLLKVDV